MSDSKLERIIRASLPSAFSAPLLLHSDHDCAKATSWPIISYTEKQNCCIWNPLPLSSEGNLSMLRAATREAVLLHCSLITLILGTDAGTGECSLHLYMNPHKKCFLAFMYVCITVKSIHFIFSQNPELHGWMWGFVVNVIFSFGHWHQAENCLKSLFFHSTNRTNKY